jgi:hypothetical protein
MWWHDAGVQVSKVRSCTLDVKVRGEEGGAVRAICACGSFRHTLLHLLSYSLHLSGVGQCDHGYVRPIGKRGGKQVRGGVSIRISELGG